MSMKYEHLFSWKSAQKHPLLALKLATPKFLKSLRNFNSPCLGCLVKLKDNRVCWINNGTQYPTWDLIYYVDGHIQKLQRNQSEFKVVKSPLNLWKCATYNYRWWVSCWADIDIRKEIKEDKHYVLHN